MLIIMWKSLLILAISLGVVSAQVSLGNLHAGARHNYNNIHLISDLNGIGKVVIQKELTSGGTLTDIMYFSKLTGSDGTYTTTVPTGMTGCVDPVTSSSVNAGGTINIPRAGTSAWLNWGNTGGTQQTANRATAAWDETKWIDIAYCDSTTTLYTIEIKLVNQLANGNDGAETTRYFWHMEASFEASDGTVLATEEVNSNCPAQFYKDSVAGTYGRCSNCACPSGYTNLCDGTSTTTYSQANDCQGCDCQVGYAAVDSKCSSVATPWPSVCATDATHANCGTDFCLPCTCDAPGMVFDKVDCPGTKTYNVWLVEKHEDVAGAKDGAGADESGGHCRTCQCSTRGYYIDPAVCSSFGNQGGTYAGVTYNNDGDYQNWVDAHCYPCSCGDKDRAAATASTFEGYYVSTEVGQCDGAWITHVRGQLKSAAGELLSSITQQPGSGVADNTYTGLASSDDNTYASGAVFSVTVASGSVTGITATSVGQNYVERDIITISKSQFGISACDITSGGRETDNSKCEAAASTWTGASCSITTGGRGASETTCEAAAGTWTQYTSAASSTSTTKIACPANGVCVQGEDFVTSVTDSTYVYGYFLASVFSCEDVPSQSYYTLTKAECAHKHGTVTKVPSNNCPANSGDWCEAGSWASWPKGCFSNGGNTYWTAAAGSTSSGSEFGSSQPGTCKVKACTANAAGVCWPTGGASTVSAESFDSSSTTATTSFNLEGGWVSTTLSAATDGGTYTTASSIQFTLAASCSNTQYTSTTACTTPGTWTDAGCAVADYTTENACVTQGTWSTSNVPAADIIITAKSTDIQAGTATAPHGGVNPTAADGAGSGNNQHNTPVAGQIWAPLAQDGINVATFANNDGWCRECACYTGLATTSILGDVRGGASPVAGSYFTSSLCPSGKPQAAGGTGTRLDASSETASQTNGKGWLDYYGDTLQTVGGPASQACHFADAANPATGTEWDCTLSGANKKLHSYDAAGDGYFINSATGKCDGKTGYTDLATAATACCTACSCSSGQFIDASSGICDGDTVHAVSSGSQPTNACVDCSCAVGQYFDLSICDGGHPSDSTGSQATVGSCTSSCNPGFQKGTSTTTVFTDLTAPNDDDGRVCRDCSCVAGDYINTASGKCDGSTGFDSKKFETGTSAVIEAARKAALNSHRTSVCNTCNCDRGGTLVTTAGGLTASYTSGTKTSTTNALVATGVIVSEDNNIALSVTYNADSTDLSAVTVTTAGATIHYIGGTLTTTNLVSKGGAAELVFTLVANDLTRTDRTAIIDKYSYINTGICNGFKINNAPDNTPSVGCTACACGSKSNAGVGWYIDQSLCEGTDTYDDTSVTATDTYCKQCHTKCSLGQYVNTDVCDGTNPGSVSNADGSQIVDGCKDCSCSAGNYIETRDSPYDFGSNTADKPETSTGSLTDTAFTTARTAGTAVDVSCDGKYQYSASLNSGNGHASACVDCTDLCTTAIQGTAKYVDSSAGKCDGSTNGARSSTATSPATVLSVNMPTGGCGSCDCVAGQYIDMQYCNADVVSATQPSAATRCNDCKCSSGQWIDYQNADSNEADLYSARGVAAEGGVGAGAAGAGDCLGTEIGTTETGTLGYYVTKSGQNNYNVATATTKAGVAPSQPTAANNGPIAPYYCITNTVADHCAVGDKLTATTSDGLLDTTCTKLKTGEQCPTSALVDCEGKCGGTSLSCPNMYGYTTAYKDSADTCEHRCVKWRGDLREEFREYLVTDVANTAICDLLRQSATLDLTSVCCSGAQSTWTTNCEAVP